MAVVSVLVLVAWALAAFGQYGFADAVLPWLRVPALVGLLGYWWYRRQATGAGQRRTDSGVPKTDPPT
jgi:hypothetical protein